MGIKGRNDRIKAKLAEKAEKSGDDAVTDDKFVQNVKT